MNKKRIIVIICVVIFMTVISIMICSLKNNEIIYNEKSYSIDLSNIDIILKNGEVYSYSQDINNPEKSRFMNVIQDNARYKSDLIKLIENGKKIKAVGIAEADYKFKLSFSTVTKFEKELINYRNPDCKFKLFITIAEDDKIYVYAHSYWEYTSSHKFIPAKFVFPGKTDAIGITWSNNFNVNKTSSKILYTNTKEQLTGAQTDIIPSGGVVHSLKSTHKNSFVSKAEIITELEKMKDENETYYFTAEYVHTKLNSYDKLIAKAKYID